MSELIAGIILGVPIGMLTGAVAVLIGFESAAMSGPAVEGPLRGGRVEGPPAGWRRCEVCGGAPR